MSSIQNNFGFDHCSNLALKIVIKIFNHDNDDPVVIFWKKFGLSLYYFSDNYYFL